MEQVFDSNIVAIKARLTAYRKKEHDIDNELERLIRVEEKLLGLSSAGVTDMPKAHGVTVHDRTADLIVRKQEIEESIQQEMDEQRDEKERIESVLCQLQCPDEAAVIRMRYLDCEDWSSVVRMLFGRKQDYSDKEDSYMRRMFKLHGSALLHMAEYMEQESE